MHRFWCALKAFALHEVRFVRDLIKDPQRNRLR